MGYESRLVFTECHRTEDGTPLTIFRRGDRVPEAYSLVVAEVDLCKLGSDGNTWPVLGAAIEAEKERIAADPDTYAYGFYEGEEFLTKDKYDEPIAPVDMMQLRRGLMADIDESRQAGEVPYRRLTLALAIVNELLVIPTWNPSNGPDRMTCLHYGH